MKERFMNMHIDKKFLKEKKSYRIRQTEFKNKINKNIVIY